MTEHRGITEGGEPHSGRGQAADLRRSFANLPTSAKVALVCSILGFVLSFSLTSSTTVNGVHACSGFDFAKIGLGLAAILAGLRSVRDGMQFPARYSRRATATIGAIAMPVGVFHILAGLYVFANSC